MLKIIKNLVHILYVKWVKGECTHLCCTCCFRNNCFDNYEFIE